MTTPAFNESDHNRVADGTFTIKSQSTPEVALTETAAEPASDAYDLAQADYWNAETRMLTANVATMRELVATHAPEVASIQFDYFGDVDGESLDFESAHDADGNVIELDYQVEELFSKRLDELGKDFKEIEDVNGQDFERDYTTNSITFRLDIAHDTSVSSHQALGTIRETDRMIARLLEAKQAAAVEGMAAIVRERSGISEATFAHIRIGETGRFEVVALGGDNDDNPTFEVWEAETADGEANAGADFPEKFNEMLAGLGGEHAVTSVPSDHARADFQIKLRDF